MNNPIKTILVFFIILGCIFLNKSFIYAQDKGIKLQPAYFEFNEKAGNEVKGKIELEYINFTNAKDEVFFREFDSKYQVGKDSQLLTQISKVESQNLPGRTNILFTIDTRQLIDNTYFFGYEIRFNNIKENSAISEVLAVTIPIILTITGTNNEENPKPQIILEKNKDLYFNSSDINITSKIGNPTSKLLNFSGEVVFVNDKDEIFYTQKVSGEGGRLFPKEIIENDIQPDFSQINKGYLPYFGKVKVYYRGVINNQRHIQTSNLEFYIIPYQLIIILISFILILVIAGVLVKLRNRKKEL